VAKRSIVHVEIPAADREQAAQFYGEIIGWDDTVECS
jgi:predicted enzyme related to lactoylglutathione lyase